MADNEMRMMKQLEDARRASESGGLVIAMGNGEEIDWLFGGDVSLFLHVPLFSKAFRSSAGKKSRFFSLFSRGSYRT